MTKTIMLVSQVLFAASLTGAAMANDARPATQWPQSYSKMSAHVETGARPLAGNSAECAPGVASPVWTADNNLAGFRCKSASANGS